MMASLRKQKRDYDQALAAMLKGASDLAGAILAGAPDRATSPEELEKIVGFVTTTIINDGCALLVKGCASPLAMRLAEGPIADEFRAAFAEKFYAKAPLGGMIERGRA